MKITKVAGLQVKHATHPQIRKILVKLNNFDNWLHAYIEYGMKDILFYPRDMDAPFDFLDEEGHWCFDYEPHFSITIMFENDDDAVLCKLQILLDIEDISIIT